MNKFKVLTLKQTREIIKQNKGKSYTYGLCRADGTLFYVGVGIRNRVFIHTSNWELNNSSNRLKINIIKKEKSSNILYVLFSVHRDREFCLRLEKDLIAKFGRIDKGTGQLTNLTDGGEIGPTGIVVSPETKEKLSQSGKENAAHLAAKNKEYWSKLSEEERQIRIDNMNSARPPDGLLSRLLVERWANEEYKKKLSDKQKISQRKISALHSQQMKEKWADPEFRDKMLLARKIARENKAKLPENI